MAFFVDPFKLLGVAFEEAAKDTIAELGQIGVLAAQGTQRFKIGKLHDAIAFHPIDSFSGFILADKPYAQWLEFGNNQGPNGEWIYPTTAKALHFFSNGTEFFRKRVRAHGPLPFMQDSADIVNELLPEVFEKHLNNLIG